MGMCHFFNLFGGRSIHLLQLFQATYRVPSFWLGSPILVECSPVMRGAPCHGCRFGWRWPCLFSFSSLQSSFARWLGKILTYDGFLGTKMDFSVQIYSCTCRCFLLPCFNWNHEKPSCEEPKQAKGSWVFVLAEGIRTQDLQVDDFPLEVTRSGAMQICTWAPCGKPCSLFCRRNSYAAPFLVGRSMDGHHWTTNMYIPHMLFEKKHHECSTCRCDTVWHFCSTMRHGYISSAA